MRARITKQEQKNRAWFKAEVGNPSNGRMEADTPSTSASPTKAERQRFTSRHAIDTMTDKQELDAEMAALLPHLSGWKLDPAYADHTWCAVLIDGTGRGIHVNSTQAKGRLYISGMWPWTSDRQQYRPDKCQHITIARSRPPEKVAAEIQRRFLPWYTTAYAEQAERVKQHNASRNRQQEVTVELATILGEGATRRMQSNPNRICASGLTVDVHGNGESVSIDLRYKSLKVAKAVLRALVKADGLTK